MIRRIVACVQSGTAHAAWRMRTRATWMRDARLVLEGDVQLRRNNYNAAIARTGTTRLQILGAVPLDAGKATAAERTIVLIC